MFGVTKHFHQRQGLVSLGLVHNSSDFVFLEDESQHSRVYGIETEIEFSPSPVVARSTASLLDRTYNWRGATFVDILNYFEMTLNTTQEFLQKVELDTGHLEFVTYPSSLKAVRKQSPAITSIIRRLVAFGFDPDSRNAGIHVNINRVNLGETLKEQKETFRKMLYFLYRNWDFTNKISGRLGSAQKNSDFIYLLGDFLGLQTEEERFAAFQAKCSTLVESLGTEYYVEFLGFSINRVHSNVIECRIFASTSRASVLNSYVEFVDLLIYFCYFTAENELTAENFKKYVIRRQKDYLDLFLSLSQD